MDKSRVVATLAVALAFSCASLTGHHVPASGSELDADSSRHLLHDDGGQGVLLDLAPSDPGGQTDQAEMLADDARTIAEQTGRDEGAILNSLLDQDVVDDYLASLPARYPDDYAGTWVDERTVHVHFKRGLPADAQDGMPDSLRILTVDLVPEAGYNLYEVSALKEQVVGLLKEAGVGDTFIAFDHPSATLTVDLGGGADVPATLSSLAERSEIPIDVNSYATPTTVDFQIRGGSRERLHTASAAMCTSGFAISRFITGTPPTSVSSLTTAAHCRILGGSGPWVVANPNDPWYSMYRDFYGFGTGYGDVEIFHTIAAESPSFYYEPGSHRDVVGAANIETGNQLCHFGYGSDAKSCEEVKNVDGYLYLAQDGLEFDHMVFVKNTTSQDGDSGGPWFTGGKAAGIHSARVSLPNGNVRLMFTPISQIASTTGVGIALKVAS